MPSTVSRAPGSAAIYPVLIVLFAVSGAAALIYELVWYQLLQRVVGSSAVSLGVILASFMGGMCLGSLFFARLVSPRHDPLRAYALLEAGVGVIGLILIVALPRVGPVYASLLGGGSPGIALRALVTSIVLLPPTVLMGATLPAIARWVRATPAGVAQLGFLYGANIAGAVGGCLLAGFYLLRLYDLATATYAAAAGNGAVALLAWWLSARAGYESAADSPAAERPPGRWVFVVIAFSGLSALGAEVVWTRLLSLLLGATVYSFSIILAVFLAGLGIGSAAGSLASRRIADPALWLGGCQTLLVGAVLWSGYQLTQSLPYWPIDASLAAAPWTIFQMDVLRCGWAMLPAACLWGASFPLALAAAANGGDTGHLAGNVYAANTVGAIAGALLFSTAVIPWWGTSVAQLLLGLIAVAAAAIAFAVRLPSRVAAAGLVLAAASALALFPAMAPVPAGLVAYGRYLPTYAELPDFLYAGEGRNASIAVSEDLYGTREFHVSGKVVASNHAADMRLQRMLGHLPALIHPAPKTVLVVGCGAGVTAGSFVLHPSVERIVICEIEPLIPPAAAKFFGLENHDVLDDPRVELVYDDARHFIATTREKFDIITSDPIHPWVKGAAALYSTEYFELTKQRLNPGGVVTQWVPLYESSEDAVKSQLATFFESFPQGTIWGNEDEGKGYDLVVLGQAGETHIDVSRLIHTLQGQHPARIRRSLADVGLGSALKLLATYAGSGHDLAPWLGREYLNTDSNLRLQYLAGFGLNRREAGHIYREMLAYQRYPEGLFQAEPDDEAALREALGF